MCTIYYIIYINVNLFHNLKNRLSITKCFICIDNKEYSLLSMVICLLLISPIKVGNHV
jgi:hypothetical protein